VSAILLDTCAVIMMMGSRVMRAGAHRAIVEAGVGDGIFVSPVTAWEIGLLARRPRPGRVEFRPDVQTWLAKVLASPGIRQAPLTFEIALASSSLPESFHDDPADWLLVATARDLGIPIVTSDRRILAYGTAGHLRIVAC
jgi:PIN domain nuclease of toxin-antitoxin system